LFQLFFMHLCLPLNNDLNQHQANNNKKKDFFLKIFLFLFIKKKRNMYFIKTNNKIIVQHFFKNNQTFSISRYIKFRKFIFDYYQNSYIYCIRKVYIIVINIFYPIFIFSFYCITITSRVLTINNTYDMRYC
jgi:hypothetical protein